MSGWNSSIPAAMDALVTLWQTELPDVLVSDGPPVGGDGTKLMVTVGYDGSDGAAQSETTPEGFDGSPNRETYTIFCAAIAVSGDGVWSPVRDQAFSLYSSCAAALESDRTLGGLVLRAIPGAVALHQSSTSAGLRAVVAFGISVIAFTADS